MKTYTGTVLDSMGGVVGSGLVLDDDGVVTEIVPATDEESQSWIIPGLIDIHCHGGGGSSFPDNPTPEGIAQAIDCHRSVGTTALVASLVSMVDPLPAIKALVEACEAGELIGIHMEGPYISPHRCGAQNPAAVRNPDLDELRTWLEAGKGYIKTMTIAPEVPLADEAAKMLLDFGALPSWGHTSGTGEETADRLDATAEYGESIELGGPAQTATHLFNAMPSLHHRHPGPIREFIRSAREGDMVVELVSDGVHVNPDLVHDVVRYVAEEDPMGVVFVTDAMAGAGMPDGAYELGGLAVDIKGGTAMLAGTDTIAGSTARLSDELTLMVGDGYLTLPEVVRACVAAPANAIRLDGTEPGVTLEFKVGEKANFLVLDQFVSVKKVIREGVEL